MPGAGRQRSTSLSTAVAPPPLSVQRPLLAVLLFVIGVVIGTSVLQGSSAAPAWVSPPPPLLQGAADRFHQAPCPSPRQPDVQRRNLVFAAVGDGWTPERWGRQGL